MRAATALLGAILVATLLPAVTLSEAQLQLSTPLSADVEHVTTVYDGGAVFVNDTISLRNVGEAPLAFVKVGLPANLSDRIDVEEAYGPRGEILRIEHEGLGTPGLYGLKVLLPEPVAAGESTMVSLNLFFSGLISYSELGYEVEFYLHPALEANISWLNATVFFPRQVMLTSVRPDFNQTATSEGSVLNLKARDVPSYSSPTEKVGFQGDLQVLDVVRMERSIFLSGEGDVLLKDRYVLRNPTSRTLSSAKLLLPQDAYTVTAEDSIGELESAFQPGGQGVRGSAVVTLRNELHRDEEASVSVSYHLQAKTYLQAKAFGTDYQFLVDLSPGINATVRQFSLTVRLPEGADLIEVSDKSGSWDRAQELFTQSVLWTSRQLTPLDVRGLSLRYRYVPLWAALRPSLLGGTLLAVGLGLFFSKRRVAPVAAAPTVPPSLLQAVVEALDERVGLRGEAERLAIDLGERRMSRSTYRARMASVSRRRAAVEKTLAERAPQLRKAGDRYAQLLSGIEEAEAEIETGEAGIEGLTRRYRAKAMSREVYERMLTDYERRVERAKATIDRLIQSLRSEARA